MTLDLGLLFPIRDGASAELMVFKAACLWNAGIIDDRQRQLVDQRARRFLQQGAILKRIQGRAVSSNQNSGSAISSPHRTENTLTRV
jgi:hypothetical protein